MSLCPERVDGDMDMKPLDESHHVVALVRAPCLYPRLGGAQNTSPHPRRGTGLLSDMRGG